MTAQNMQTLSRPQRVESRPLKAAGLIIMALSAPPLFYVSEQAGTLPWNDVPTGENTLLALLYLAGANILAVGLLVLLPGFGFGNPPLRLASRAKRGVLYKMVGANLLVILFGLVKLNDYGAYGDRWERDDPYIILGFFVVLITLGTGGVALLRRGWKYDALPAQALLATDPRPPVVYIRSFAADENVMLGSRLGRWLVRVPFAFAAISVEQELATIMSRIGPVVAIGKPGEPLPQLGAARLYASDDEWRNVITDLMQRSSFVVVRAGATANLRWEIDRAVELLPRRRLLFVCFEEGEVTRQFDADIEQRFGKPHAVHAASRGPLGWLVRLRIVDAIPYGKIVYFDSDSLPRVKSIGDELSWTIPFAMAVRPYWVPLNLAFKHVFRDLAIPWKKRKNRVLAALLAAVGGLVGTHHFYLGNRRRGLWYLALSASVLVPLWSLKLLYLGNDHRYYLASFGMSVLLLAWIDAVRMLLMTEQDFQRKFVRQRADA